MSDDEYTPTAQEGGETIQVTDNVPDGVVDGQPPAVTPPAYDPTPEPAEPDDEPPEIVTPGPADYTRAAPSMYAIGVPGVHPRIILSTPHREDAEIQAQAGEVCLLLTDIPAEPYILTADGTQLSTVAVPLSQLQAAAWVQARAYRDHRQESGCETPLGRVDTDSDSQRKINGAVTAAMVAAMTGAEFAPITWTMTDNTPVVHDAAAMIAMGMTVVAFLDACQNAGTAVRAAIEAAPDETALAAVDITAGYPE
jgi:hypothetical protein